MAQQQTGQRSSAEKIPACGAWVGWFWPSFFALLTGKFEQMCVCCVLEWILFSGKEGQKYLFSLALNIDKFLYENEYKAFDIQRETEFRSSVLMKCSIKEALLFKEFFFFVFVFKYIDHVLTTL